MNKKADASANNTNGNKVGLKLQMLCLSFKTEDSTQRSYHHKNLSFCSSFHLLDTVFGKRLEEGNLRDIWDTWRSEKPCLHQRYCHFAMSEADRNRQLPMVNVRGKMLVWYSFKLRSVKPWWNLIVQVSDHVGRIVVGYRPDNMSRSNHQRRSTKTKITPLGKSLKDKEFPGLHSTNTQTPRKGSHFVGNTRTLSKHHSDFKNYKTDNLSEKHRQRERGQRFDGSYKAILKQAPVVCKKLMFF